MGFLHIPYNMSKPQDGLGGRLSVHMMFESLMSDWALAQPILFDTTMCDAAASISLAMDLDTLPAEAEAEPQPEHQDWATRDTWEQADDQHQQQHQHHHQQDGHQQIDQGSTRSGLEPKVIGLLVNLYRYGGRASDVSLWDRVRRSADKLYYARENISTQVDKAMRHR